jgi:hypothetical protein
MKVTTCGTTCCSASADLLRFSRNSSCRVGRQGREGQDRPGEWGGLGSLISGQGGGGGHGHGQAVHSLHAALKQPSSSPLAVTQPSQSPPAPSPTPGGPHLRWPVAIHNVCDRLEAEHGAAKEVCAPGHRRRLHLLHGWGGWSPRASRHHTVGSNSTTGWPAGRPAGQQAGRLTDRQPRVLWPYSRLQTLTDASWCTMAAMSSAVKSRELPLVTTPVQEQGQGQGRH